MAVTTTKIFQSLIETAIMFYPSVVFLCVTTCSLGDGIVLWELQEKKCQQRVCQHTDVVQTGQVGWMVLILQWKMVKSEERSVLATVIQVADTKKKFL